MNFSFGASLVGIFLMLTLYVQQALGFSALTSGVGAEPLARRLDPRLLLVGALLAPGAVISDAALCRRPGSTRSELWRESAVLTIGGVVA